MVSSPPPRLRRADLLGSGFSAAELAGMLHAGATPAFCRSLLAAHRDRNAWLAAPLLADEGPALRSALPLDPPEGVSMLAITDPRYPEDLLELSAPPPVLFVLGDPARVGRGVGVVGSRSMSEYGSIVASLAAATAVQAGAVVVSGLARGVDAAAHEVAVDASAPTLAVLGCGLGEMDERQSRLAARIVAAGGAVCSEFLHGTPTSPGLLIARNRIVAALSYPLVVAEGSLDSGTSHTVRAAASLGRPLVVAVPRPRFRSLPSAALPLALAEHPARAASRFTPPLEFANVPPSATAAANAVCDTREELVSAVKVFWWLHAPSLGAHSAPSSSPVSTS